MYEFVGIDFGTSTTLVAASKSGLKAEVVDLNSTNKNSVKSTSKFLPSVIAWDGKDDFLFGNDAENAGKDYIRFQSPKSVITEMDEHGIDFDTTRAISEYLKHIKKQVEESIQIDFSKTPVRFGCPAYWNAAQREVLANCATNAGFKKITLTDLQEEPIAAGLGWFDEQGADLARDSYVVKKPKSGSQDRFQPEVNVLVFDMGGGTLDLALLRVHREAAKNTYNVSVRASDSSNVSGDAVDTLIASYFVKKFSLDNPSNDPDLLKVCEQAKIDLSTLDKSINPFGSHNLEIDRFTLNKLIEPIVENAMAKIRQTLTMGILGKADRRAAMLLGWKPDASLDYKSESGDKDFVKFESSKSKVHSGGWEILEEYLDVVVLAGGMCHIPAIQDAIKSRFPNTAVVLGDSGLNLQEMVVLGLATSDQPKTFDAFRPPVDVVLTWLDRSGQENREVLFTAFDPLYENSFTQDFRFGRLKTLNSAETTKASLTFESRAGKPLFFDFYKEVLDKKDGKVVGEERLESKEDPMSLTFSIGPNRPFVFKAYLNGQIYIQDSSGVELAATIDWPEYAAETVGRGKAQAIKIVHRGSMFIPMEALSPHRNTWTVRT